MVINVASREALTMHQQKDVAKRDYAKPALTRYGSVVQLTEGSLSTGKDADSTQTKKSNG